jgi:hypothetical protein
VKKVVELQKIDHVNTIEERRKEFYDMMVQAGHRVRQSVNRIKL